MRVMFLIPGINQDGNALTWPLQMSPRVNRRGGGWCAQPFVYETTALTVDTYEEERIETLAKLLKAYEGCEIHVAMHSNGNRVGVGAWNAAGRPKIKTLHMLCGACDSDFETLGLNAGLMDGSIEQVFCYVATSDTAMRIENTIPGDLIFGIRHKPLGLDGPSNVNPSVQDRVRVIHWDEYDHSTCFDSGHFQATYLTVIGYAEGNAQIIEQPPYPPMPKSDSGSIADLSPRQTGEQILRVP